VAASMGFIDEVIMPHATRKRIALGLRKLRTKQLENPWKKHDNIPLIPGALWVRNDFILMRHKLYQADSE
jgi:hypothetical protein